jgi:predicted transposase YbfD/YdcC
LPKKTFEAAEAAKVHLIVQLKDNQLALCRKVAAFCHDARPLSGDRTIDAKCRNRHETRLAAVFDATSAVAGTEWASHVAAIIQVERDVLAFQPTTGLWKQSRETSFYLSNHPIDATQAADAIRKHWGIENGLHYVRDVTLREDASRIRTNPGIFARLRSFAYNILRFNQKGTIAQDRYAAALGGFDALAAMSLCQ